jgi:hypothetical protein
MFPIRSIAAVSLKREQRMYARGLRPDRAIDVDHSKKHARCVVENDLGGERIGGAGIVIVRRHRPLAS